MGFNKLDIGTYIETRPDIPDSLKSKLLQKLLIPKYSKKSKKKINIYLFNDIG